MYKKTLSALWLVTSLFTILLTSCGAASSGKATPTPLPPMVSYEKSVFTVEIGPIVSEKKIFGEIMPSTQDDLYFLATGYVDRVTVKQGDTAKKVTCWLRCKWMICWISLSKPTSTWKLPRQHWKKGI